MSDRRRGGVAQHGWRRWSVLRGIRGFIIGAASSLAGLSIIAAGPSASDPEGSKSKVASASVQTCAQIGLEEFRAAIGAGEALVLDARPEIFHRLGHIPGALSLPRDAFEVSFARLLPQLEKQIAGRPPLLLLYCQSASCEDALLVANALARNGFSRLAIFQGGWDEWERSGLPVESARNRQ